MEDPQELEKLFAKYPSLKKAFETGVEVSQKRFQHDCLHAVRCLLIHFSRMMAVNRTSSPLSAPTKILTNSEAIPPNYWRPWMIIHSSKTF